MKPKIKPRLMWAVISKSGSPRIVPDEPTKEGATEYCYDFGETVQRVLVIAPPKRRKHHAKR